MSTQDDYKFRELAQRYRLEPMPESVARLTDLVSQQESDVDLIAKVVNKDKGLTARLLRAANPGAMTEEAYEITTVDEALMRIGIGCVLLLAMGAPLSHALIKTFQTMLGMKLETVNPNTATPFLDEHVLGTIGFSGKAEGKVYLRLSKEGARLIASQILGLTLEELTNNADVTDAVGELLNIITGNFKSNLCDAGLDCRLHTPSVTHTDDFSVRTLVGGGSERMAFRSPQMLVYVDVTVNPWGDD